MDSERNSEPFEDLPEEVKRHLARAIFEAAKALSRASGKSDPSARALPDEPVKNYRQKIIEVRPGRVLIGGTTFRGQQGDLLRFAILWLLEACGGLGWALVWGWLFHKTARRQQFQTVKHTVNTRLAQEEPDCGVAIHAIKATPGHYAVSLPHASQLENTGIGAALRYIEGRPVLMKENRVIQDAVECAKVVPELTISYVDIYETISRDEEQLDMLRASSDCAAVILHAKEARAWNKRLLDSMERQGIDEEDRLALQDRWSPAIQAKINLLDSLLDLLGGSSSPSTIRSNNPLNRLLDAISTILQNEEQHRLEERFGLAIEDKAPCEELFKSAIGRIRSFRPREPIDRMRSQLLTGAIQMAGEGHRCPEDGHSQWKAKTVRMWVEAAYPRDPKPLSGEDGIDFDRFNASDESSTYTGDDEDDDDFMGALVPA